MSSRKENDKRVFRCIYQSSLSILDSYLSSPSVIKNKAKPRVFNFGWPPNRVKNNTKPALGRRKVGRDRLIRVLQPRSQRLSSYRPLGLSEEGAVGSETLGTSLGVRLSLNWVDLDKYRSPIQ